VWTQDGLNNLGKAIPIRQVLANSMAPNWGGSDGYCTQMLSAGSIYDRTNGLHYRQDCGQQGTAEYDRKSEEHYRQDAHD